MPDAQGFRRVLGPFDATCIVVGAIVGVGIFFTPSTVARLAGSGWLAMLAWGVGGFIAMTGALTFAELGGRYPRTAGQYEILRDSYGSLPAFMFVFCNATVIIPGSAAIIAIICAQNIAIVVYGTMPALPSVIVPAAVLVAGLSVVNAVGVKWGAGVQNATVVAKVAALVAIIALAVIAGAAPVGEAVSVTTPPPRGWGIGAAIFAALVPAFFSYGGWQQVLWVGGEVRDPARTLPRAITFGVIIVVVIYLVANWAYLRLLGAPGVATSGTLAADAVAAGWPGAGMRIVAAAVAVSAFGVLNVQFLSGPRLIQGLAEDGRFFRFFSHVHATRGTPIAAIVLLAGMSLLLLLVAAVYGTRPVDQLLTGVVFVDCVFFALTGASLVILRQKRPDLPRPVSVPLYPLVPIAFVLGEVAILVGAYLDAGTRSASYIGVVWLLVAAALWWPFRGRIGRRAP